MGGGYGLTFLLGNFPWRWLFGGFVASALWVRTYEETCEVEGLGGVFTSYSVIRWWETHIF